jgi:general stress protein YciG
MPRRNWRAMAHSFKNSGRKGGLKISADRKHMSEIGRKGGEATAAKPGHIARMTQASIEARLAKKQNPKPNSQT